MRTVLDWDTYFMDIAHKVAQRSKDPRTQVGAVIVDQHMHPVMTGYNGFPPGVDESEQLWSRPTKYARIIHAEMNAIAHAARVGHSVDGCTLYTTMFPCNASGCARIIIAAGIMRVVAEQHTKSDGTDHDQGMTQLLFAEAGVDWEIWSDSMEVPL